MGIPDWTVQYFESLYQDNLARVHFCGIILASFPVGRGVRQGCPASMLVFALALDPVCRWLVATGPPRFGLPGYADDVRFLMTNLFSDLVPVFLKLCVLADAIGLELHFGKCIILLGAYGNDARTRALLVSSWGGCELFSVVRWCRYLGVSVGPEAHMHSFPTQCDK
eukprot:4898438-Pyramimonas_sp.AAC.1